MNVAIYARVSTDEQAEHGYSLDAQIEKCHKRAVELGATKIDVYKDEGISGAVLERPGLTALRKAVRSGAYSYVVITSPDRFARSLAIQLVAAREIERYSTLIFTNEEYSKTPEGSFFFQMRGAIAEYERAIIAQRMTDGRIAKARKGGMPMGVQPYGYDYDPVTDTLKVNEAEAAIVRRMYHMLVHDGMGINGIAHKLNAEGIPTKRRAPQWSRAVVRQILLNRIYIGDFTYAKSSYHDVHLNKYRAKEDKVKPTPRPEEEWIHVPVPRIVDDETWYQAQEYIARAKRLAKRRAHSPYLLSGLVKCGSCGHTMPGCLKNNWGKKIRYYTCFRSWAGAQKSCGQWVKADDLETVVWSAIWRMATQADITPPEQPDTADEIAAIDALIQRDQQAKQRLIRALTAGVLTEDDIIEQLAQINNRIVAQTARREELLREQQQNEAWDKVIAAAKAEFARLDPATLTFGQRQQLVRQLVREVIVYPTGEVSIDVRGFGVTDISAQDSQSKSRSLHIAPRTWQGECLCWG